MVTGWFPDRKLGHLGILGTQAAFEEMAEGLYQEEINGLFYGSYIERRRMPNEYTMVRGWESLPDIYCMQDLINAVYGMVMVLMDHEIRESLVVKEGTFQKHHVADPHTPVGQQFIYARPPSIRKLMKRRKKDLGVAERKA